MPSQSTVNMVQVVDFLTGKGVSKEEAMEVRTEGGGWRVKGGGWRLEGGGWRVKGGGWRLEGGGWRVEGDHFPSTVLW